MSVTRRGEEVKDKIRKSRGEVSVDLDAVGRRNTAIMSAMEAEAIRWRTEFLAWIARQKEGSHEAITEAMPMLEVLAVYQTAQPGVSAVHDRHAGVCKFAAGATGGLRRDRTTSPAPGI
jgi:hypothetical protein